LSAADSHDGAIRVRHERSEMATELTEPGRELAL
jgi:hypothetical protein